MRGIVDCIDQQVRCDEWTELLPPHLQDSNPGQLTDFPLFRTQIKSPNTLSAIRPLNGL